MGHPADAQTHRGPHPGLHSGGGRDQPDPVGGDATRLDRHLLQQESRDSEGLICFFIKYLSSFNITKENGHNCEKEEVTHRRLRRSQ